MIHTFSPFCILFGFWVDFSRAFGSWVFSFLGRTESQSGNWEMFVWHVWYGFMVIHQFYPFQIGYTANLSSGFRLVLIQRVPLCSNFLNFFGSTLSFPLCSVTSWLSNPVSWTQILWALVQLLILFYSYFLLPIFFLEKFKFRWRVWNIEILQTYEDEPNLWKIVIGFEVSCGSVWSSLSKLMNCILFPPLLLCSLINKFFYKKRFFYFS